MLPSRGSGNGVNQAVSTPEPRISAIRPGSTPSPASAAASSGFCATTGPTPARNANPSTRRRSRPANCVAASPEPSPMTASIRAGAMPRRNARRCARAPNKTGFSAT